MRWWHSVWSVIVLLYHVAWNSDSGLVTRIRALVVVNAFLLLFLFMLDTYRTRSRNLGVKFMLVVLDKVSGSMVYYTSGLMQSAGVENVLFQEWILLLVIFYQSVDYVSAYSLEEQEQRREREVEALTRSIWVAYLIANRKGSSYIEVPLWLLLGAHVLKILYRVAAFEVANHSYNHGRNSRLVADYMKYEHELSCAEEADPAQMIGYKYLVFGEAQQKQKVEQISSESDYMIRLEISREDKFITLDKIWRCKGRLLSASGVDPGGRLKDVCLSFAFFKLLRRRFDQLHPLPEADLPKTRALVFEGLLDGDEERAFRVVEVELGFLTDYFFTTYPIIFANGFPVVSVVLCLMSMAGCCFLVERLARFRETHLDVVISFVVLSLILAKELWEMATYVLSDWARVVLICKYVEKSAWQKSVIAEMVLSFLCRCKLHNRCWHNQIQQYSLLESYQYTPRCRNLVSSLTLGGVTDIKKGGKKGIPIRIPRQVKRAIVTSLRFLASDNGRLTNGLRSLQRNGMSDELSWACRLRTHAHTVLAWHIATGLCEIKLNLRLNSVQSLGSFAVEVGELEGDLQVYYVVANSLSRYCAYLLVYMPQLLPDHNFVSETTFKSAVKQAREHLQAVSSMQGIHDKLTTVPRTGGQGIIELGARLGSEVFERAGSEVQCWKVLADVWAEMILFLAPSSRTDAHKTSLATGGEFITHLWALLSHAGILEQPPIPHGE